MDLQTLKDRIADHISNSVDIRQMPYSEDVEIDYSTVELAAEKIMFMLINDGIVKITQI